MKKKKKGKRAHKKRKLENRALINASFGRLDKFTPQHAVRLLKIHGPFFETTDLEYQARMPYGDYLATLYWQRIRNIKFSETFHRCQRCLNRLDLQVHHKTYDFRGREHLALHTLEVLCRNCHEREHGLPISKRVHSVKATKATRHRQQTPTTPKKGRKALRRQRDEESRRKWLAARTGQSEDIRRVEEARRKRINEANL